MFDRSPNTFLTTAIEYRWIVKGFAIKLGIVEAETTEHLQKKPQLLQTALDF